jgi:hypothetical protein
VVIYAIGVGTASGQPIPVRNERGDVTDYKKDDAGSPVISRLDESTLAEIARIGQGATTAPRRWRPRVVRWPARLTGWRKGTPIPHGPPV